MGVLASRSYQRPGQVADELQSDDEQSEDEESDDSEEEEQKEDGEETKTLGPYVYIYIVDRGI